MKKSLLSEALQCIEKKDLNNLKIFSGMTSSGLPQQKYERNKRSTELFNQMIHSIEKNKSKKFNEEIFVNKYIKPVDDWNKIKSTFLIVIRRFLISQHLNEDHLMGKYFLIQFFKEKNKFLNMNRIRKKALKEFDAQKTEDYGWYEYKLYRTIVSDTKNSRNDVPEFKSMKKSLINLFQREMIQILFEELNRIIIFNLKNIEDEEEAIELFINENYLLIKAIKEISERIELPIITIYFSFLELLQGKDNIENVIDIFKQKCELLIASEAEDISGHLMNYCISLSGLLKKTSA